jgi:hypothetical protein
MKISRLLAEGHIHFEGWMKLAFSQSMIPGGSEPWGDAPGYDDSGLQPERVETFFGEPPTTT